jgi:CPA2 family monovalent cation:H+ antiporter-2
MHVDIHLTEIAIIVVAALGCGLLFERFHQPAVLGYILAGIILSLPVFNLIQNHHFVSALAELGVLMLLFLIGMELSLRSFKAVWHISLICMLLQVGGCFLAIFGIGKFFNWPLGTCLLIAFAIALSSTAVAVKMLESIDELKTDTGRITIGILIAQDLAIVPMILFLRSYESGFTSAIFIKIAFSIGLMAFLSWYLGRKEKITLPFAKIVSNHHDLLPLAGLVFCFGMAAFSGLIGLSAAYGAFLGGLILGNTAERNTLIQATKPIQSVLLMVFFLSIGLLIDLSYIWHNLGKVLILLVFITLGKTILNIFILNLLGQPWPRAFLVSLVISQMGEFAFLLATIGMDTHLIQDNSYRLIITLTALSLAISPIWLAAARRLHDLAPTHMRSLSQLLTTAYSQEIGLLSKATTTLKKTIKKLRQSLNTKDKP